MATEQVIAPVEEKPFAVSTVISDEPRRPNNNLRLSSVMLATIVVVVTVFGAYLFYQLLPVVFLLLLAILIATAIEPLVNKLRRGPFSRTQGILVVYTGIIIIIAAVLWLTVPLFLTQIGTFISQIPNTAKSLREFADGIESQFLRQQVLSVAELIDQVFRQPTTGSATPSDEQITNVTETAIGLAEGFFSVLAMFVIAFYWLTERTLIKRWFISLLPSERANRVRRVWDDIEVKVGGWVRGQLTIMLIVGLVSAVGYFIIGVSYWPALALFIALAEAIPLVGPYIGTAPAILVALTQTQNDGLPALLGLGDIGGIPRALLVMLFAVILQTVEGNILIPRIMRNSVGISPLTVMVSILIGAAVAGLAGALLAVPLAGVIQVIIADLRAAAKSERDLEIATAAAEETRRHDDELVVAKAGAGGTVTEVRGEGLTKR